MWYHKELIKLFVENVHQLLHNNFSSILTFLLDISRVFRRKGRYKHTKRNFRVGTINTEQWRDTVEMERKRASLLSWTNKYSDSGLYKQINISIILLEDIYGSGRRRDAPHPNTMREESLFSRFRRASISSHVARNFLKLGHGFDVQNRIYSLFLRMDNSSFDRKIWKTLPKNACIQSCVTVYKFSWIDTLKRMQ